NAIRQRLRYARRRRRRGAVLLARRGELGLPDAATEGGGDESSVLLVDDELSDGRIGQAVEEWGPLAERIVAIVDPDIQPHEHPVRSAGPRSNGIGRKIG